MMYTKTWYDRHESQLKDNGKWRLVDLHWNKAMGTVNETWQKDVDTAAEAKDEKQADEVKDEQQFGEVKMTPLFTVDEQADKDNAKQKSKRFKRGLLDGKKKKDGMKEQA